MLIPADRLRSLVKEASPLPWPYITATFSGRPLSSDMADRQLMYLAPQLAELVADMDDLLRRLSEWDVLNLAEGSGDDGPYWQGEIAKVRLRLAALFPEDSA